MSIANDFGKPNYSKDKVQFENLREALKEQVEIHPYEYQKGEYVAAKRLTPIPFLDDKNSIRFLYCGLEITINNDGTWDWEDTTGG